jgi:uncharacterized protein (TIGR00730 family)
LLRAVRIFLEFMGGFRKLDTIGPCVTVFGSARFEEDNGYYELAREAGHHLAKAGFTVVTGGGPGIMEAASRGAKEAGGYTVGCNIDLPQEQDANPYLDLVVEFQHFFLRKVMLVKYSYAFMVLPGGFGTFDEVFETATLIQTAKIEHFPVVLLGTGFWSPVLDLLRAKLVGEGTIDEADLAILHLTDSPQEGVQLIRETVTERCGLPYPPKAKRGWAPRK